MSWIFKLLISFNNNQMSSGFDLHKQQIITLGCNEILSFGKAFYSYIS